MSIHKPIQLGLCCMNITLKESTPSIYSSRNMIIRIIEKLGIEELKNRITLNLIDLKKMIEWNEQNGIKVFRISSNLFPHKTNEKIEDYTFDFARDLLKEAGNLAKSYNQRITMHPGQYNVIGTPHEDKFQQTMRNLDYQAELLDLMGMGKDSVMVIHGGGLYGDKEKTKKRWCENFYRLPERVRKRLVIENCERIFSIEDCLDISNRINIPVVMDTHHFNCYTLLATHKGEKFKPPGEYIPDVLNSWKRRGIKPKFHVSEQCCGGRVGKHSDFIDEIPRYLLEIPLLYNTHIDIMIEAKKKELSIQRLYKKYPFLNCKKNGTHKIIKMNTVLLKRRRRIYLKKKLSKPTNNKASMNKKIVKITIKRKKKNHAINSNSNDKSISFKVILKNKDSILNVLKKAPRDYIIEQV